MAQTTPSTSPKAPSHAPPPSSAPRRVSVEPALRVASRGPDSAPNGARTPGPKDKGKRASGLQAKLLLLVLPVANFALLGIWLLSTMTAREGLLALSSHNLQTASHDLAAAVGEALSDAYADARTTAALDLPAQAIETGDAKNMIWYANELVRTKPKYVSVVVTDVDGQIVASNTVDRAGKALAASLVGKGFGAAPWLASALASAKGEGLLVAPGRPAVLEPMLSPAGQVVGFAMPVFDIMDDAVGVVSVFVSLDTLAERLKGLTVSKEGVQESLAAIVDGGGRMVVAPPGLVGNRATWQEARWPTAVRSSVEEWVGPGGNPFYLAQGVIQSGIPGLDWRLAALRTVAAVEAPVGRMGRTLLLASALAVALTTLVIALAARRFVGPIVRLTESIASTGRAADFKPVQVETHDEVGVLAKSFNGMFATIVDHEVNLERRVEERTAQLALAKREVSDILDNMLQGVFTIGPGGIVDPHFSAYCKTLFGDVPIAGRSAMDLLQVTEATGQEAYSRMKFWLATIFGCDDFQWMLSEDEGVRRLNYRRGSAEETNERIIEIEYAPIYVSGEIHKVMVLARDVTDIEALKSEVEQKDRENQANIQRVTELANLSPEVFLTFVRESSSLLVGAQSSVESLLADSSDRDAVNRLFRSVHTLKGNCRVFNITRVQDMCHEVESKFQEIRDSGRPPSREEVDAVVTGIRDVSTELESFEQLGRRILLGERASDQGSEQQGAREVVAKALEGAEAWVEALAGEGTDLGERVTEMRAAVQALEAEVARVGLGSVAGPVAVVAELLAKESPERSELAASASALLEGLRRVEEQAKQLANRPDPARVVSDAASLLARIAVGARSFGLPSSVAASPPPIEASVEELCELTAAHALSSLGEGASKLRKLVRSEATGASALHRNACYHEIIAGLQGALDDAVALAGAASPVRGKLTRLERLATQVWRGLGRSDKASLAQLSERFVEYQTEVRDCRLEWFLTVSNRLGELLQPGKSSMGSAEALGPSPSAVQGELARLATTHSLLRGVGVELRQGPGSRGVLARLGESLREVDKASGAARQQAWTEFAQLASDAGLGTLSALALAPDAEAMATCRGLLQDASSLVDGWGPAEQEATCTQVPDERLAALRATVAGLQSGGAGGSVFSGVALKEAIEAVSSDVWALTAVPLAPLLERMSKMLLTLSIELDKGVELLRHEGGHLQVSPALRDKLRDVLLHTLRNALDHGVESRRDREASGKALRGRIGIRCERQGKELRVVVEDDGRGINTEAVRRRARDNALVPDHELAQMDDKAIWQLIFRPGFSTSHQVTQVSGRGVGMDVVKSTVEELGGRVELRSLEGRGASVVMHLPV